MPPTTPTAPRGGRYRLTAGQHIARDTAQPVGEDGRHPSKTYRAGDVVVSDTDLAARYGRDRFIPLGGSDAPSPETPAHKTVTPAAPPPTGKDLDAEYGDLDKMTKAELLEVAAAEEIDVPTHATKDDILRLLRKSEK